MTHVWHDTYRHPGTPAHHLDPRAKLLISLLYIGTVLFPRRWGPVQLIGYPAFLAAQGALARISLTAVVKRTAGLLPFALLMLLSALFSTRFSFSHLAQILVKAALSVAAMALLSMTTPFPDFLRAFEQCRLPKLLVMFLAFLARYAAVLGGEVVRLERGRESRTFGRFRGREWSRTAHVLAALLIRSYERAERVYAAMLSRGFSNRMPPTRLLHFGPGDILFMFFSCGFLLTIQRGGFW